MTPTVKPIHERNYSLPGLDTSENLGDWVGRLAINPLMSNIIATEAFQRLTQISFLGALDHIALARRGSLRTRTRADHSLHVAALASFVAHHRGYDEELRDHLIVAALLHDIGHAPLSHSAEPYLQKRFGYGHHQMGEMLLAGDHKTGRTLRKILATRLDTSFICSLIAGNASGAEGGDLFSSPINIDTIEGIIRSYRYLCDSPSAPDPLQVAFASFLTTAADRYAVLDKFWNLKGLVYNELITQDIGLMADQYCQLYLEESNCPPNEEDLFGTEQQWRRKYKELFQGLAGMKCAADRPAQLQNISLHFNKRYYVIEFHRTDSQRYKCIKQASWHRFVAAADRFEEPKVQQELWM